MTQVGFVTVEDTGSEFGFARFFLAQIEFSFRWKKLQTLLANLSTIVDGFALQHDTYLDMVVALEAVLANVLVGHVDPYSRLTCQGPLPTSSVERHAGVAAVIQGLFLVAKLLKKTQTSTIDRYHLLGVDIS